MNNKEVLAMATYVKVNDVQYAASITGRLNDKDWNNTI